MDDYQILYEKAKAIAMKAHAGQKDKGGMDYITHPLRVSELCRTKQAKIAALLHDVVEDSDVTCEDLMAEGIPKEMVAVVDLLTLRPGIKRQDYIRRLGKHPIAREVKMADLLHNMDPTREVLPAFSEGIEESRRRYYREFLYLYENPPRTDETTSIG